MARLALKIAMVAALSLAFGSLLIFLAHACGPRSAGFAFLLVWLTMCWVTLVLSAFPLRLPDAYYNLRPGERDGRRYEKAGVLVAKRALRRGPLQIFNPKLHLPTVRDPPVGSPSILRGSKASSAVPGERLTSWSPRQARGRSAEATSRVGQQGPVGGRFDQSAAARLLGITRRRLYSRLESLDEDPSDKDVG